MTGFSQMGFWDRNVSYGFIDDKDSLLKIDGLMCWDGLRILLNSLTLDRDANQSKGGRPPKDRLMMGKILLLQSMYNLSDEACEFQINDRLSFKRFVGLDVTEKAPDAKTIWLWRERLIQHGYVERLFAWFQEELSKHGYAPQSGQIVDATFVPTHRPTGKMDKQIAEGKDLKPAQKAQKDNDATFTKKRQKTFYGYKNHISADEKTKLISAYGVTTASTHDSVAFDGLLESVPVDVKNVWADSAYRSQETEEKLAAQECQSHINERAYRNKPLTDEQKALNREKSKTRSRVEHVFGHMTNSMGGLMIHTIGFVRAQAKVGLKNTAYNIQRFVFLQTQKNTLAASKI